VSSLSNRLSKSAFARRRAWRQNRSASSVASAERAHRLGRGSQPCRVRSHVRLGEQERRDVCAGDQRQPALLLLLGAEQQQRLGDADRLVRREQGRERGVHRPGQRQCTPVTRYADGTTQVSFAAAQL
jgi:hypothetical protein